MKSDQPLKGASTCHLKARDSSLDKKVKFGTDTHYLHVLDCVHVDVWGPTKNASLEGHRYFVSVIDDYSRHYWVHPMRQKVEALELVK